MKRPPKMFRKKKANGKFTGSWRVAINGTEVNLGTSDAEEAGKRLQLALKKGKRNFASEVDEAAAAVDGAPEAPPAAPPLLTTPPAPQAPTTPPIVPDDVIPPARQLAPAPSAEDARAEAEATNAAAADVGGGSAANDNAGAEPPISDEVLDSMLATGALVIVDLQLQLQAYAIKRGLKVQAGPIAPDDKFRALASQAWASQLKVWFPSVAALPPWGAALLLPLACIPAQLAGATPLPKEDQQGNTADPPAQEAA